MQELYSSDHQITVQDVPDEISLAISLSGCPLHCPGCHSSFTWDPTFGELLTDERFNQELDQNPHISCVLFYGGEWKIERLHELIEIAKNRGLKVCLYTGLTLELVQKLDKTLLDVLDYIKVGPFRQELGPLNMSTTNQRMYRITHEGKENKLEDITKIFQRKIEL